MLHDAALMPAFEAPYQAMQALSKFVEGQTNTAIRSRKAAIERQRNISGEIAHDTSTISIDENLYDN